MRGKGKKKRKEEKKKTKKTDIPLHLLGIEPATPPTHATLIPLNKSFARFIQLALL
jgi:hypothetical protein